MINYHHQTLIVWLSTQRMQTKHIIWHKNTCRLNMYCRDIWKDMYFEMHTQHHELNVWNAHQTSWAELKTWKQNVDTANILYFNTPDFVVPTTLNPAMAKTHRSRHWAKYVSSYPTSLDNKIPTTSLALQGKFHEVPTVSRFVCVGFHWKPLLLLSSTLGLWSSNASLTTLLSTMHWMKTLSMFSSSSSTSMVDFGHPMQRCNQLQKKILLLYSSTITRKQTPTLAVKPKSHAWKPKITARHHNIMLLTTNQCFQTFFPSMFSASG